MPWRRSLLAIALLSAALAEDEGMLAALGRLPELVEEALGLDAAIATAASTIERSFSSTSACKGVAVVCRLTWHTSRFAASNVIIAGGMGMRAKQLFDQQDIRVVVGAPSLAPESVAQAFLEETLQTGPNLCDH